MSVQHPGMRAEYRMDGNAKNTSGYPDLDGTPTNVTYAAGLGSQVGVFNGTNAWLQITDDITGLFSAAATLTMWARLDVSVPLAQEQTGAWHLTGATNSSHYPFLDGKLYLNTFRAARIDGIDDGGFDKTQWHHLAITTTPGANGWKLYRNAVVIHQATGEAAVDVSQGRYLARSAATNRLLAGNLARVRLYDFALSAADIKRDYLGLLPLGRA